MERHQPTPYARCREAAAVLRDVDADDEVADRLFGKAAGSLLAMTARVRDSSSANKLVNASRARVCAHLESLRHDLAARHVARVLYAHRHGAPGVDWYREVVDEMARSRRALGCGLRTIGSMASRYARWTGVSRATLFVTKLTGEIDSDPAGRRRAVEDVRQYDVQWAAACERVIFTRDGPSLEDVLAEGLASLAEARRDDVAGAVTRDRNVTVVAVERRTRALAAELTRVAPRLAREIDAALFGGSPPKRVTHTVLRKRVDKRLNTGRKTSRELDADRYVFRDGPPPRSVSTGELLLATARTFDLVAARYHALQREVRESSAPDVAALAMHLAAVVVTASETCRLYPLTYDISLLAGLPVVADHLEV